MSSQSSAVEAIRQGLITTEEVAFIRQLERSVRGRRDRTARLVRKSLWYAKTTAFDLSTFRNIEEIRQWEAAGRPIRHMSNPQAMRRNVLWALDELHELYKRERRNATKQAVRTRQQLLALKCRRTRPRARHSTQATVRAGKAPPSDPDPDPALVAIGFAQADSPAALDSVADLIRRLLEGA